MDIQGCSCDERVPPQAYGENIVPIKIWTEWKSRLQIIGVFAQKFQKLIASPLLTSKSQKFVIQKKPYIKIDRKMYATNIEDFMLGASRTDISSMSSITYIVPNSTFRALRRRR